jgi:hypothetical protein
MWRLANAKADDAVKLVCGTDAPTEELGKLNLDALTEFKRGANGVVELKFTDRARLLERLLDEVEREEPSQMERFLHGLETEGDGT